eukprot:NODE_1294_length_2532_cov_4.851559.p2 GENE.NODE_1294_length_2532_cov_4.851559~~NODE_1294_length_2532_cov_4.851559.p2  ORF type:complete len:357 (+),score=163.59 NODE_1294_length_2532_cov_4.851559:972-2042(+)
MLEATLGQSFADFSVPSKDDGFDAVSYEWDDAEKSKAYLLEWVRHRKRTTRVEGLVPGPWFLEHWGACQRAIGAWRRKQTEWKNGAMKKKPLPKVVQVVEVDDEEKKEGEGEEKKEGEESATKEEEPVVVDAASLNPQNVEDVTDIGNGEPLFAHFEHEDWALLTLRAEMHYMLHAFRRQLDDADRPSFPEDQLNFYYQRFFKRAFDVKLFGVATFQALTAHVKDAVAVEASTTMLEAKLPDDVPAEKFVRTVEEQRRDRLFRLEAGDETAALHFVRGPPPQGTWQAGNGGGAWQQNKQGGGGGGFGGYGGKAVPYTSNFALTQRGGYQAAPRAPAGKRLAPGPQPGGAAKQMRGW